MLDIYAVKSLQGQLKQNSDTSPNGECYLYNVIFLTWPKNCFACRHKDVERDGRMESLRFDVVTFSGSETRTSFPRFESRRVRFRLRLGFYIELTKIVFKKQVTLNFVYN